MLENIDSLCLDMGMLFYLFILSLFLSVRLLSSAILLLAALKLHLPKKKKKKKKKKLHKMTPRLNATRNTA